MSEHYGVEQLIQYDATTHRDDRLVDNPRRAHVRQQLAAAQADVVFKEAEVGRLLAESPRGDTRQRPG